MPEELLLTITEAAEVMKVKSNTLRVWLCKGRVLPENLLIRLGRRTFLNKELLIAWLKSGATNLRNGIYGGEPMPK